MLKKQSASQGESTFCLIGRESNCVFEAVSVNFRAPFNLNKTSNSIIPTYFRDGNCYTPAFILPRQKDYYEKNTLFEKINFQEKLFQIQTRTHQLQKEEIKPSSVIPPIPENNYCQVCKINFVSYFAHIEQTSHQIKVSQNNSNRYIQELCQAYNPKQFAPKIKIITKTKSPIRQSLKKYPLRLRRGTGQQKNLGYMHRRP